MGGRRRRGGRKNRMHVPKDFFYDSDSDDEYEYYPNHQRSTPLHLRVPAACARPRLEKLSDSSVKISWGRKTTQVAVDRYILEKRSNNMASGQHQNWEVLYDGPETEFVTDLPAA